MRIPEALTKIGHGLFGFLSALSVVVNPTLTVIGFLLFMAYELNEEWHLHDEAYEELREFGYGFAIGMLALLWRWFYIP